MGDGDQHDTVIMRSCVRTLRGIQRRSSSALRQAYHYRAYGEQARGTEYHPQTIPQLADYHCWASEGRRRRSANRKGERSWKREYMIGHWDLHMQQVGNVYRAQRRNKTERATLSCGCQKDVFWKYEYERFVASLSLLSLSV